MGVKDWRPNPETDELPDGTNIERWLDRGMLHRAGAPARTEVWPDGTRVERWYEGGRLLASVLTTPDGERTVDEAGVLEVPLPGGVLMFVRIPPGTFLMGDEKEKPVHVVTLMRGLWIAVTQTTHAQWQAVMGKNPSSLKGDPNLPVEEVSWEDCVGFIKALAPMAPEGLEFDLPTEAEWEYSCRADSTMAWSFGDDESAIGDYAWFGGNANNEPHPVGTKRPNAWGLYDMHGNVWEWCKDWYEIYKPDPVQDPQGPQSGAYRVLRGGGYSNNPSYTRSAIRGGDSPASHGGDVGVRPVLRSSS